MIAPNVALVMISLVTGWAMLLPAYRRLGPIGYQLAAFPAGLLVWPVAACVTQLLGVAYRWPAVAPISLAFVALVAATLWWLGRRHSDAETPDQRAELATIDWRSFAIWGGLVLALAVAVEALGVTVGFRDSLFHYELSARWLTETGTFNIDIPAAYGYGLTAILAANHLLGGEWTFVIFPIMSMNVLALAVWTAIDGSSHHVSARWRALVAVVIIALMATAPVYLQRHSVYTHSHMISALYFLLGVVAAVRAFTHPERPLEPQHGHKVAHPTSLVWMLLAGLSAAGMAFARVDGMVYQLVLMMVATVVCLICAEPVSRLAPMFVSALAIGWATNLAVMARLGIWDHEDKLDGKLAIAVLGAVTAYAIFVLLVGRIRVLDDWLSKPRTALPTLLGLNITLVIVAWGLWPKEFWKSTSNMIANLTYGANYGKLWYFAFGVLLLSLIFGHLWRKTSMSTAIAYGAFQFLMIAMVVHALTHPGRIHPGDSFARVAFSLVPPLFVYAAIFANGLVASFRDRTGVS